MPTKLIAPFETGSDFHNDENWGISAVGAKESAFSGDGVIIAVLDTGIDRLHNAFNGLEIVERDFIGDGNGDQNGHGTHCAGIIFGRDINETRIGVARGVRKALISKVLGDDGKGNAKSLYDGMIWAINQNANIMSISLGFDYPGLVENLRDSGLPNDIAVSRALERYRLNIRMFDNLLQMIRYKEPENGGVIVVAASGNESRRDADPEYTVSASIPAAADGVISVGAIQKCSDGFIVPSFSNTNVTICAPGVDISSAKINGGLIHYSGTSLACPHVAGVAALWWEATRVANQPVNAQNVKAKLISSAKTDGFRPDIPVIDRGVGIVKSP